MFRSNDMPRPSRRFQNSGDRRHLLSPFFGFAVEPLSARFRQTVIFCAPAVLRSLPLALDQPGALQALQRDKQRTCIHAKNTLTDLLDPHRNPESMHRLQRQRFQNQHVQRALHQVARFLRHQSTPLDCQEVQYAPPLDCQEEKGKYRADREKNAARLLVGKGTTNQALGTATTPAITIGRTNSTAVLTNSSAATWSGVFTHCFTAP